MAIQFEQPITAGTVLIRSDIRSQNFVAGSAGWRIEADGDAEFNSVIIRGGTVVSGLALYYNGTPAAGNLVMSISATAGVDSFGNAYVAGVGVYGTADKVTVKSSTGNTAVLRADAPSYVADSTAPGLELRRATEAGDGASITEYDDTFDHGMLLLSPSPVHSGAGGDDFSYIQMIGRFSADPSIQLVAGGTNGFVSINGTIFDANGEIITYANSGTHTFTPTVGNAGTATFSTRTGYWIRVGNMYFVNMALVVNAAGSGAGIVSVTVPFNVDRTIRQAITMHCESVGPNGSHIGDGECVFFTGGTGGVADRLRNSSNDGTNRDSNLTGADLLAGGIITIQGWLLAG